MRITVLALVYWFSGCLAGCAAFNPGGQVASALRAKDTMKLGGKEGLDAKFDGTHGVSFMYAKGNVKITFDADGNIIPDVENSQLTELVWKKGSTQGAAGSLDSMAQMGIAQTQMMTQMLTSVMSLVGGAAPPPAAPANDRVADLLEDLSARLAALEDNE